jgi:hypothetical protein
LKASFCFLSIFWLISVTYAADLPRREIRLQGDFNFNQIIGESENQLDLSIRLPSKIKSQTSRKYNQIITLKQLCDAIVSQFAQNNIPLVYSYSKDQLIFQRSDVPKNTKRSTFQPKPQKQIPSISEPPKPSEDPYLPSWANKKTPSQQNQDLPVITRQGVRSNNQGLNNFEEPFQVTLPSKNKTPQSSTSSPSGLTDLDPLPTYRSNSKITPSIKSQNQGISRFSITPYPENATAFINDAPSIVPGTGKENYIEWETRMRGALENQNIKVLENERLELERRIRWLDQQLP